MSAQLFKTKPKTRDGDVAWLKEALEFAGWLTAGNIRELSGWNERYIRELAEASRGEIISGQRGYRLTKEATREEVQHAASWLKSQAKKMIRRAIRIERRWHG